MMRISNTIHPFKQDITNVNVTNFRQMHVTLFLLIVLYLASKYLVSVSTHSTNKHTQI
jgi:hypothetical protein